ncbi:ParA family protein [Micromonospora globbae]|uniref:ParA family protein n=1 Tax=Micromonospora globbae TaxID=1894969 RepID=UPI00341E443A
MALTAVCSAKRSPGATVTALAFTLSWARRVILAECDPAGGDIAAGFLREVPLADRGLARLGAALRRRRLAEDLWNQLVDLAPANGTALTRLVLPGLIEPAQARTWADQYDSREPSGWEQLAQLFRSLESGTSGYDVIADCGRLTAPYPPTPLLAAADVVLLVARPDLPSIRAAAVALPGLQRTATGPVGLVLVGDGAYSSAECAAQLHVPVVATLPHDPGAAAVLSNGGEHHRGRLLRAAARAEAPVWRLVTAGRAAGDERAAAQVEARGVRSVG